MDKVKTMGLHVGYPKYFESHRDIDDVYSSYPDVGSSFLTPWLTAIGKTIEWQINNHTSFRFSVYMVNAYYHPTLNKVVIPAMVLLPPLFVSENSTALSYGGLGAIVGHEMTHAFDVDGSHWDGQGNLRDWWTPQARVEYTQRMACLRQSHGLEEEEQDGENTADFAGLVSAYNAYSSLAKQEKVEGLEFNAEQLFFIASCIKWCATSSVKQAGWYATFQETLQRSPEEHGGLRTSLQLSRGISHESDFSLRFLVKDLTSALGDICFQNGIEELSPERVRGLLWLTTAANDLAGDPPLPGVASGLSLLPESALRRRTPLVRAASVAPCGSAFSPACRSSCLSPRTRVVSCRWSHELFHPLFNLGLLFPSFVQFGHRAHQLGGLRLPALSSSATRASRGHPRFSFFPQVPLQLLHPRIQLLLNAFEAQSCPLARPTFEGRLLSVGTRSNVVSGPQVAPAQALWHCTWSSSPVPFLVLGAIVRANPRPTSPVTQSPLLR
ncbi:hypothetical protein HPB48_013856 [Haemaphysalis longicornis]|uniref:Peptidase M13 C-terminal domain-containing protein n=1 Tax=Haemaphysalis longicornis TaxID=44386 RepID=A0A9J6GP80_HAELO|nr:hypothetical protein HPB48_013856 [Haemaphysalis longicornis]